MLNPRCAPLKLKESRQTPRFSAKLGITLKRVLCVMVALLPLLLITAVSAPRAFAAPDPISAQIEISPSTVTGPYSVRVSITINNIGDDAMPGVVILYDPDGGKIGSYSLGFQKSQSWTGNWNVTQAQLDAGKVVYKLSYPVYNDAGVLTTQTKNLTAGIKYNKVVAPSLQLKREITPTNPKVGDTVRIDYTIKNSGNGAAVNVDIEDTGIGLKSGTLVVDRLEPGSETVKSFEFKATTAAVTSAARLTYQAEGSTEKKSTNKASDMKITPVQVNITATLTVNKDVVNKGTTVNLTCEIVNKGNIAYKNIRITDPRIGEIASGISIKAGKTHKEIKSVKIEASGSYKFLITGEDANGATVEISSNEVTINTIEDAVPVDLSVTVTCDRDYIYKEPSVAIFTIGVKNNGSEPVKKIQVTEADRNLYVIDSLKPGEEYVITKEFTLNFGGKYQFRATAENSLNVSKSFDSNVVLVEYKAPKPTPSPTPTLSPTPTIEPTPSGASAAPPSNNTSNTGNSGTIIRNIFIGLLALVIMGVGAMLIIERTRSTPAVSSVGKNAEVYDHLDRSSRRDYTRVQRGSGKQQRASIQKQSSSAQSNYQPQEPDYTAPQSSPDRYSEFKGESWVRPSDNLEPEITNFKPSATVASNASNTTNFVAGATTVAASQAVRFGSRNKQQKGDESSAQPQNKVVATPEKPKPEPSQTSKVYDRKVIEPETGELGNLDGQYVLTKRAGSIHPKSEPVPTAKDSEDPASFAKKQRARRSREINLAQFYDEDE